jgi:hypothetical protein
MGRETASGKGPSLFTWLVRGNQTIEQKTIQGRDILTLYFALDARLASVFDDIFLLVLVLPFVFKLAHSIV